MTGWWVTSSSPTVSTTQSSRTAETVVHHKGAVSAGISSPISTFSVSAENNRLSAGFLAFGLCTQKFRSWRLEFRGQ